MNEAWAVIKTNKMVLSMNMVICGTLTGGYIVDVLKGRKTILFVMLFLAVIAIDLGISLRMYLRDKASLSYKYYSIVGYLMIYCYAMFASDSHFTFVFIYPMLVLFFLYLDTKLLKFTGTATVCLNIAKVIYQVLHGHTDSDSVTAYMVQMALAVLVSVGMYFVTDLVIKLNDEHNARMRKANKLAENVDYLHEILNEQVQRSEDIVQTTDEIKTLSEHMTAIARNLSLALHKSSSNVKHLDEANVKVNKSSSIVYETITELHKLSNDITKITKLISDIALKTNILALNASVEATRAGEHNNGFMAVAEEVGTLATQSVGSAKQISTIINTLCYKISQTLEEVKSLIQNNTSQNDVIGIVKTTFKSIEEEINSLNERINVLDMELTNLSRSNRDISESTQRIADIAARSQVSI